MQWLVRMLLGELLQKENPTQPLLQRILRRLAWEWPSQGSGFGNLLCFCRGLSSVSFRSGHTDLSLYQYYKLLVNFLAEASAHNIPGTALARTGVSHCQSGRDSSPFQAQLSGISQTTPSRGSVHPTLGSPADHSPAAAAGRRNPASNAFQRAELHSSSSIPPGLLLLCFPFAVPWCVHAPELYRDFSATRTVWSTLFP